MLVSTIGASATAPAAALATISQPAAGGRTEGSSLPQDRVSIGRDGQSSGRNARHDTTAGNSGYDTNAFAARKQHHYPGQKGYVAPPISAQFDQSGQHIRSDRPGSRIDISA